MTTIDAIEVHEPYIKDYHRYFYNTIHIGDAATLLPRLPEYDLIIAGDVIEHFDAAEGRLLIAEFRSKARAVVVGVPLGEWQQGAVLGNEHETHRATWVYSDIERLNPDRIQLFTVRVNDDYATFSWGLPAPDKVDSSNPPGAAVRLKARLRKTATAIRALLKPTPRQRFEQGSQQAAAAE